MKLLSQLLDGFKFNQPLVNQPLVNAYQKHEKSKRKTKAVKVKKIELPTDYVVRGAWVVKTREEAKKYYPKLIANQDAALREFKYGVPADILQKRQFGIALIYFLNIGTAVYGLYTILAPDE